MESFIFSEINRIPNWQAESVDFIVYYLAEFNAWLPEAMIRRTMLVYDRNMTANKKLKETVDIESELM